MVVERSDSAPEIATRARGFDLWPVVVATMVVVVDQITKAMVIRAFGPPEAGGDPA